MEPVSVVTAAAFPLAAGQWLPPFHHQGLHLVHRPRRRFQGGLQADPKDSPVARRCPERADNDTIKGNAMMPSIISHDLMRANEEETVRATRYAHHRAHIYRRPGPFLASLLQAWMSRIPVPRRLTRARIDLSPIARDPLRLAVLDLGTDDIGGIPLTTPRDCYGEGK
jgi:hypothetical protein